MTKWIRYYFSVFCSIHQDCISLFVQSDHFSKIGNLWTNSKDSQVDYVIAALYLSIAHQTILKHEKVNVFSLLFTLCKWSLEKSDKVKWDRIEILEKKQTKKQKISVRIRALPTQMKRCWLLEFLVMFFFRCFFFSFSFCVWLLSKMSWWTVYCRRNRERANVLAHRSVFSFFRIFLFLCYFISFFFYKIDSWQRYRTNRIRRMATVATTAHTKIRRKKKNHIWQRIALTWKSYPLEISFSISFAVVRLLKNWRKKNRINKMKMKRIETKTMFGRFKCTLSILPLFRMTIPNRQNKMKTKNSKKWDRATEEENEYGL